MKLHSRQMLAVIFLLGGLASSVPTTRAAEWSPDARQNAALPTATRAELYKVLDSYLAALKARDPQRVKWAPRVRNTENNVAMMAGDGLWGTITALGSYDLRFADTLTGQVGYFGTVTETTDTSAFTAAPEGGERRGRRSRDPGRAAGGFGHQVRRPGFREQAGAERDPAGRAALTAREDDHAGQRLLRHPAAQRRHAVHEVPRPTASAWRTA